MLKIVIAESELELVPHQICGHSSLRKLKLKKKPFALLDSNFYHRAMQALPDAYRRGRPDIVHICLLCAMESPLNKKGELEVYVHTRNDEVIYMSPLWKVPKSYHRFVGLMEQLFEKGRIDAGGHELLRIEKKTLLELLNDISSGFDVKVMNFHGEAYESTDNAVVVIGGFSHGDFKTKLPYEQYSIFQQELVAWSVLNHVIYTK
ncbi:MAG: 16S rRNA methyltransferase [Candidatus Methanofastidiosia archaeon]